VYREHPEIPRFVCIVCYKTMSAYAGACRTCGVDRLDLTEPLVREQVRLEAEKRLQKQLYREYSTIALAAAAAVAPSMWWIGSLGLALAAPVAMVFGRLYIRVKKNTAIAMMASRRQRISAELGVDVRIDEVVQSMTGPQRQRLHVRDEELAQHADVDPQTLELERLLDWLGCKLESP
jgi:hypothetical protein